MDAANECRIVIGDRFSEVHPFIRGAAGLYDFAVILGFVPELSDDELRHVLNRLLDLLSVHWACCACYSKLAAYGELFAGDRWPGEAEVFGQLLDERVAEAEAERRGSTGNRDFRAEVKEVVAFVQDIPRQQRRA